MGRTSLSLLLAFTLIAPATLASTSQTAYAKESQQKLYNSDANQNDPEGNPEEPSTDAAPSSPQPASTTISGLITEKALAPTSKMTNTIKVSPANGRTVKLQKQLSSGKWKTIGTYTTSNKATASVKLTYPTSEWKGKKHTTWRVSIPATETANALTSDSVLLYTKNRTNIALNAKSAIVMNATTNRVLYSKNMNIQRGQASITKVMTTILAIENNSLSKKAKITKKAARTPWTYVPFSAGNKVTVKNLLYAALLPSSNGSATALAETTSGSVKKFAKLMNKKARELGLENTHYVNAHGLTTKGHYSSAYDTGLLMSYAIKNKTFKKIIGTRKFAFKNTTTKQRYTLLTTNRLLKQNVKGVVGGKTGTTDAAGCCFTCVYKHNGQTYITVVLGCKTTDNRFNDTKKLISYAKKYGW